MKRHYTSVRQWQRDWPDLRTAVREGKMSPREAWWRAETRIFSGMEPAPRELPDISTFCTRLRQQLYNLFREAPASLLTRKLESVIEFRADISPVDRTALVSLLRTIAKRAHKFADALEGKERNA